MPNYFGAGDSQVIQLLAIVIVLGFNNVGQSSWTSSRCFRIIVSLMLSPLPFVQSCITLISVSWLSKKVTMGFVDLNGLLSLPSTLCWRSRFSLQSHIELWSGWVVNGKYYLLGPYAFLDLWPWTPSARLTLNPSHADIFHFF